MDSVFPRAITAQLEHTSADKLVFLTLPAPMEERGTLSILNVFALRILSGMDRRASLVETDKFILAIRDAVAPLEHIITAINASAFLLPNANQLPMLSGMAHNAPASLATHFKDRPASAMVSTTTGIVISAIPSQTLNGLMEFVSAFKDTMRT